MTIHVKTPCASAVLLHFGVSGVTWNERTQKNVWADTLRRNGFNVRSRMSKIANRSTVGGARKAIVKMSIAEPRIIGFVGHVAGHVLVIDCNGITVVDTAPRNRDSRRLLGLTAVMRK